MSEIDDHAEALLAAGTDIGAAAGEEADVGDGAGRVRRFANGTIYWSPSTGAAYLPVTLADRYRWRGGPREMGFPVADAQTDGKSSWVQTERAAIADVPRPNDPAERVVHDLFNGLASAWIAAGGSAGAWGDPTESDHLLHGGRSRKAWFAAGLGVWHEDHGAHLLPGAFGWRYAARGGPLGPLGYPTGATGTGFAFENGELVSSDRPRAVHGKLFEQWSPQRSTLGPPTTAALRIGDEIVQHFEKGVLKTPVPAMQPSAGGRSDDPTHLVFDWTVEDFLDHHAQMEPDWKLADISRYGDTLTGVWLRRRGGDQQIAVDVPPEQLEQLVAEHAYAGRHPVLVAAGPAPVPPAVGLLPATAKEWAFTLVFEEVRGPTPIFRWNLDAVGDGSVTSFGYWSGWSQRNHHRLVSAARYGNRCAGIWWPNGWSRYTQVAYQSGDLVRKDFMSEWGSDTLPAETFPDVVDAERTWAYPAVCAWSGEEERLAAFDSDAVGDWSYEEHDRPGLEQRLTDIAGHQTVLQLKGIAPDGGGTRYQTVIADRARPAPRELTMQGTDVPSLRAFDDLLAGFVRRSGGRHGTLALSRQGRLVYARTASFTEPGTPVIDPTARFRFGSCSKQLTMLIVLRMQELGVVTESKLVDAAEIKPPPGMAKADGFDDILIDDLLRHRARVVRNSADEFAAAQAYKTSLPVTSAQMAGYMSTFALSQPVGAYANVGYLLLSRVVDENHPGGFLGALYEYILAPCGLTRPRPAETEHVPGQPVFEDPFLRVRRSNQTSARPPIAHEYGNLTFTTHAGSGGMSLAAADFTRILDRIHDPSGPLLDAHTVSEYSNPDLRTDLAFHGGLLAGCVSFTQRLIGEEISIAASGAAQFDPRWNEEIEDVARTLPADAWPAHDLYPTLGIT